MALKKKISTFFLILNSVLASATDYYVSSTGNDFSNGLSESTPWKTISKLNSALSGMKPGDRILFKRGDVFYGSLNITCSGTKTNPIVFGAYGTGANPVITGFRTVSSWTYVKPGIYRSTQSFSSPVNLVALNGSPQTLGRYPNTGYMTFESHVSNKSITDYQLTDTPNWSGAEIVLKHNPYSIYRNKITNHQAHTITFTPTFSGELRNGYGYFIQNSLETLDSFGEWYHDGIYLYMFFGDKDPDSYTVQASTIDRLVYIYGINYVTIENITFQGANVAAIRASKYNNIRIQHCNIEYSGRNAITFVDNVYTSYFLYIDNCIINHTLDCAINLNGNCTNSIITNNTILNSGLFPGMGRGLFGAIYSIGPKGRYEYNIIENTGRNGIWFHGDSSLVKNNFIKNFCLTVDDAGGIYLSDWSLTYNKKITGNIVLNAVGNREGVPNDYTESEGIYIDYNTKNVEISGNTVAFCKNGGIKLHGASDIIINQNTCFNNNSQLWLLQSSSTYPIKNISLNDNFFIAHNTKQMCLTAKSVSENIPSFCHDANNNYYARPIDDNNTFATYTPSTGYKNRSLSNWQSYSGQDPDSKKSPVVINDTADIKFYYNASKNNKEIKLIQPMLDVKGTSYLNSVILEPFTSVILMVDPDPPVPVVPVYVSSVINNRTPNKVEISYTVTLDANSVPLPSDFIVKVNGTERAVTSVAISGTKVILTLTSPVIFGDMVTISYTSNPGKPLQTPSTGQAENLTDVPVKNNIADPSIANEAPKVVVDYEENVFSGFVYELDASGTTDADNDDLTFTWTTPSNTPVSDVSGSKIRYLTPLVSSPQPLTFELTVSDGKTETSASLTVNNSPYKQELGLGSIKIIEASNYYQSDYPGNVDDGDLTTKWSAKGDNHWITLSLAEPFKINHVQIALLPDQKYESYFDLFASRDNIIWEPLLQNGVTCGFSGNPQNFKVPVDKSDNDYYFVKLLGHGNALDSWNNYSEIRLFGSPGNTSRGSYEQKNITIYPNPARDFINLFVLEPTSELQTLRIFDMTGKLRFETSIDPGIYNLQIPLTLSPGVYIAQVLLDKLIKFAQTLVIAR